MKRMENLRITALLMSAVMALQLAVPGIPGVPSVRAETGGIPGDVLTGVTSGEEGRSSFRGMISVDSREAREMTLEEAFAAARETIDLREDIDVDSQIRVEGCLTLNLNGSSISRICQDAEEDGGIFELAESASLTINGGDRETPLAAGLPDMRGLEDRIEISSITIDTGSLL